MRGQALQLHQHKRRAGAKCIPGIGHISYAKQHVNSFFRRLGAVYRLVYFVGRSARCLL